MRMDREQDTRSLGSQNYMQRNPKKLIEQQYDILVIGGGITGACIAHDAVLRGFSVALVEKGDFGGYTSSASSKLLHGGVRYLPKGQVWKVRESAREQAIFQRLAPHLTHWLPFLIPTQQGSWTKGRIALKTAMKIYQMCCAGLRALITDPAKKPPVPEFLDREHALLRVPHLAALQGLNGAQVIYESHMYSSERMTLAFLKTAAHNGVRIANYMEVKRLLTTDGRVTGAALRDSITGEDFQINASLVVNTAGPYVQAINSSLPALRLKNKLTGFARGVHLVTRQIEPKYALALTTKKKTEGFVSRGGRHFFILPWRGRSLIGTTNVPFPDELDDIKVTSTDVQDFLADINDALPDIKLTRDDVYYSFTGIYPLIAEEIKPDTYQGTGEYQIVDHGRTDGVEGVVTALGAKYTTARNVAAKTVNLAAAKLHKATSPCCTEETPLLEGKINDLSRFIEVRQQRFAPELPEDAVTHLIRYYGTEIDNLVRLGKEKKLLNRITPDRETLEVEIVYAVQHEMAQTLDDVIFRRTGLGIIGHPGHKALNRCADMMGELLGWDESKKQRQIDAVNLRYDY